MSARPFANRCGGCGAAMRADAGECNECGWRTRSSREKTRAAPETSEERKIAEQALAARIREEQRQATEEAYLRHPELRQGQYETRDEWVARMRDIARGGWRKMLGHA
jgi:predicted ATP-dependent serine protease